MNKIIILITFLFLIPFLKGFCKIDIDNTVVFSNETYLSYQIPLGSENITSIIFEHFDGSQFQLNLECSNSKNSNSATCFTTINDEQKRQMLLLPPNPVNKIQNNITIKIGNLTCLNVISISTISS
ncbi:hypothetical protein ACTFIR_005628 [Dictyostelium discoideum]